MLSAGLTRSELRQFVPPHLARSVPSPSKAPPAPCVGPFAALPRARFPGSRAPPVLPLPASRTPPILPFRLPSCAVRRFSPHHGSRAPPLLPSPASCAPQDSVLSLKHWIGRGPFGDVWIHLSDVKIWC